MSAEAQDYPKKTKDISASESLALIHDEIVVLWAEIQGLRKQRLLNALPEGCRKKCSIAKIAISRVMEEGTKNELAQERLAECPGLPYTVGTCGTTKTICSHPESGNTEDFSEQIGNLYEYIQKQS